MLEMHRPPSSLLSHHISETHWICGKLSLTDASKSSFGLVFEVSQFSLRIRFLMSASSR